MKANQKKAGQQAAAKPGRTAKPRKDLMAGMRLALAQHGGEIWAIALIAVAGLASYLGLFSQAVLALLVSLGSAWTFFVRIDRGLPLAQVAGLLACLQWLVGPVWYFEGKFDNTDMGMAVTSAEYFHVAVPATAAFVLGLFCFRNRVNQREVLQSVSRSQFLWIGLWLNMAALAGDLGGRKGPESLAFAFILVSQLRYIGVLYLWFSPHASGKWLAGLAVLPLFFTTAETAMFHDMLLWSGLMFSYWFASRPRLVAHKLAVIAATVFAAFLIQGIKESYRAKVWNSQQGSLTAEIQAFWTRLNGIERSSMLENAMVRLNQGWIVSHVIRHVPAAEPFAGGDTVSDALVAAALPRFLLKDKAMAGGRSNFFRFTGMQLNEATSMNLSLLGEGYANFGATGGMIFLFFTGFTISALIALCLGFARTHPLFIFWMPLIFYQAIKAETDLNEILNHMVKGGMAAFACYWVLDYFYPTSIVSQEDSSDASKGRTQRGLRRARTRAYFKQPSLPKGE